MVPVEPSFEVPHVPPEALVAKSRSVGTTGPLSSVFTSGAKSSALASRVPVSPVVRQSFGAFASSFAKQPFVGSIPPQYFACAFAMQAS